LPYTFIVHKNTVYRSNFDKNEPKEYSY